MDKFIYGRLHDAADRLALEAARKKPSGQEADCYIETYEKALAFLMEQHKKHSTHT